tara:strand:+ start:1707 stop:3317 length:1611 start_codon:yes stop_codon:yes gene_type:complete
MKHLRVVRGMPKNRHLQNVVGTEHIKDAAEQAIAAQAEGGATLAFKNVAVSGQSSIVADAATDTLNIAAGANVTITTNASTDTITIAATDTNTDTNTFRPVTAGGNTLGASETLAFTAGSNVTISESGGAVTIAATGGSPGGSDTQIQYNNGGSFGGISSFTYDDTTDSEKFIISASSDQDLVRITQTGSGNAFVVEDAANPDSTRFAISNSGDVGIGTAPNSSYDLFVLGDTRINGSIQTNQIQMTAGGSAAAARYTRQLDTDTGMFFPNANEVAFTTGGTERIRVGSAGQIGIAGANYGTSGQVLTSGGASGAISWAAAGGTPDISLGGRGYIRDCDVFDSSGNSNTALYCSALGTGEASSSSWGATTNPATLTFFPIIMPKTGTLSKLGLRFMGGVGGSDTAFGLYRADSTKLRPTGSVIFSQNFTPSTYTSYDYTTSLSVTAGEILWLAWFGYSTTLPTLSCISSSFGGGTPNLPSKKSGALTGLYTAKGRQTFRVSGGTFGTFPTIGSSYFDNAYDTVQQTTVPRIGMVIS